MWHFPTPPPFECGWRCLLLGFKLMRRFPSTRITANRSTGTNVTSSLAARFHTLVWYTLTTPDAQKCKYVYSVQVCMHTSQTQSCMRALMVPLYQDGLVPPNWNASQQAAFLSVINWLSTALQYRRTAGTHRIFTVICKLQATFSIKLDKTELLKFYYSQSFNIASVVNQAYFKLNTS
jgi:hypothetical protein